MRPETISPLSADLLSLRIFKIMLRGSSHYPKQLPLF